MAESYFFCMQALPVQFTDPFFGAIPLVSCHGMAPVSSTHLALLAGTAAGAVAGLITGLQQTKLQINAILAGILTMTGLYTVNYMVLGGQANLYLQHAELNESGSEVFVSSNTIYKMFASLFPSWDNTVAVLVLTALLVAAVAALLCVFFKTRPGMAIQMCIRDSPSSTGNA